MVRLNKPALIDPATAHEQHDANRRGVARIKSLRQQVTELSAQKTLGGKPPYLRAPWLDGRAGPAMATALHEAGLVIDETTLGDQIPPDTGQQYTSAASAGVSETASTPSTVPFVPALTLTSTDIDYGVFDLVVTGSVLAAHSAG